MASPFPRSEPLRADPVAPAAPGTALVSQGQAAWDSPVFEAMYEEYSRPIYYLALRMLGDPTQAEDATHDVFLKAYRKLGEFKGQSTIRTWLYRITINHCQNLLQTWHRRHIQTTDDEELWERAAGASESP